MYWNIHPQDVDCKLIHNPLRCHYTTGLRAKPPYPCDYGKGGEKRTDVVPAESRTGAETNIRLQHDYGKTGISMMIPAAVITHLGMPVRSSPPPPSFLMPDE